MYTYRGKQFCISNKLRNRAAHATNGNGSCFSVSVIVTASPDYTQHYCTERCMHWACEECRRSPRSGDNKIANREAHSTNGNGTTENLREAGNEINRDIEATVTSTERSNEIDVQAIKLQEEAVPDQRTSVAGNTFDLAFRRVQLTKFTVTADSVVDTLLYDADPFLAYYNATLNHNSSMSTFRDVYFDLEFDVVVQSLPSVAGIMHFVFDRFGATADGTHNLFAYPIQMVDLSSKDSLSFTVKMDLPQRVLNTVKTPFGGMGNGLLKCYLATPCIVPTGLVQPVTVTVFARAINVTPYNLKTRTSVKLETSLVALDQSAEQSICERGPASNFMRPVEIAKHWGFHQRTVIPNDTTVGAEIISVDLHPMEEYTPMACVCSAYSYYRGSIRVKLTMNLSKLQNITLAAVFVPVDASFDADVYESFAFTEIMFDEKHEAVLNVQYSSGSNWLPIFVGANSDDRAMFGSLVIILRSPIVSTVPYGNAPTLLVQTAAGPDFEVAHPRDFGKNYNQPALLEMNPEVPRRFATGTANLYEDARLPVFYTRLKLSKDPLIIPVTCTRGNGGVLGLLKNTHAAWSGSLDYYVVFEGEGQCEIRYDPTKRFAKNATVFKAPMMPTSGYCKFVNSRSNPSAHISVPFCSLYDYLPTRAGGMAETLNNSNCNGALFIQGTGIVRIYRAAGRDFRVHFYNSMDDAPIAVTEEIAPTIDTLIKDPLRDPAIATVSYGTWTPTEERAATLESGFFSVDMSSINNAADEASVTMTELRSIVPGIRRLLESTENVTATFASTTDAVCSLLSGPTAFAKAILSVATGGISAVKNMILSIHGVVTGILEIVTPAYILKFCSNSIKEMWTDDEIALLYTVAIISAAMAIGIENSSDIICCIALIGLSIPTIATVMGRLVTRLFDTFAASAAKAKAVILEAPSPLACGASLLMAVVTFFIPNKDFNLHAAANIGKDVAGVFSGAKAIDEMLSGVFQIILQMPGMGKILGSAYKDITLLSKVDVEEYVREVKDTMCTDFFNIALTNEMVRQQERLWKVHKELDVLLPTMTKTNFFFNSALRKVMDEQQRMYKHAMTFKGSGRERFPPFICMLGGQTRVGKSHMTAEMMRMVCKMMNWDHDVDIYTRQPTDPYFSGLAQQKIFYCDDLHTNITSNGADSDMAMVMAFGTNSPWAPNMAALDDKGRNVPALLGMFCTNTLGEPSNPGIRNVPAYLARRHLCIQMRWKKGVKEGDYAADFSHADFVLLDPHDREAKKMLDENFEVARSADKVKVYEFPELWKLISTRFVHHLIRERKIRHARRVAGKDMELPPAELLEVARDLAAHYDDVDYLDIDRIEALNLEALTAGQMQWLGAGNPKYADILNSCTENELRQAIGDIIYVRAADSFTWRGKHEENLVLYSRLLAVASDGNVSQEEAFDSALKDVEQYIAVLTGVPEDETEEFYDCIPDNLHELVRNGVSRRKLIYQRAETLDTVGKKCFKQILADMYARTPRWLCMLLGALSLGGAIYYGVKGVKGAFKSKDPLAEAMERKARYFAGAEYQKELAPAIAVPVRKTPLSVQAPEYANELAPAVVVPVKRPTVVPAPEYAKEMAPAVVVPVKRPMAVPRAEYANELAPAIVVPVKPVLVNDPTGDSVGRAMISYAENPRASHESVSEIVTLESAEQIENAIELYRYGRFGKVRRDGVKLHFLFLDDRTIYVNRHFWTVAGGVKENEEVTLYWNEEFGPKSVTFGFKLENVRALAETDHSVYHLGFAISGIRSNWKLLPTEKELAAAYPSVGVLLSITSMMDFTPQRCAQVKRRLRGRTLNTYINLDGSAGARNDTTIYLDGFSYPASSGGGTCGSLLIFPHSGGKIFGIHVATLNCGPDVGSGVSQYVYREQLEEALTSAEPLFQVGANPYLPEPVYEERDAAMTAILTLECEYEPIIDMSPYGLRVVGTTSPALATRGSMFTSYRPSAISKFFPCEPFRVPAILQPGDRRAPGFYDPRPDIMGKYNKVISPLPAEKIAIVVDHLSVQFGRLYHPCKPSGLLSLEQAVNGIPGAVYFDAINFHTSPGLPYSLEGYQRKSSCFTETGTYSNGMPIRTCSVQKVEDRFNAILSAASRGDMVADVLFQEFMKDELLKRAKVFTKPATRGIANPPLDLLLAERAAFLPFIALLQYNRHAIDAQVGINPMSGSEWTELVHRLQENSDLVFDADYTAFDSTIHPTSLDAFADVCNNVMGGTFATQLARKTLVRYAYDRVSQVTNVQVKIDQGMASGMPFTASGNSFVNSLYLRVAWLMLAEESAPDLATLDHFDKNVRIVVYGDDNLATVKAQVADWYNLRTIALVLEPFGILMTDGAKNPRHMTQPFSNWTDVRFLKRAFVLDPATGNYLAPLDRKTIIDRVRYVKAKAWLPDLEMRIEMSLVDCVFHGKDYFEAFKFLVNNIMEELDLPCFTVSYEAERKKWEKESTLLQLEAGADLVTYARRRTDGNTEVFYAYDNTEPTRIGGRWSLPLGGPRLAEGTEGNNINVWQIVRATGGPSPPTSTGGVTLQQLVDELNKRPTCVTRAQIEALFNTLPRGVSMVQLQSELDGRPVPVTLAQLQYELSRLNCNVPTPPPPTPPSGPCVWNEVAAAERSRRKQFVVRADDDNYKYNANVFSGWSQFMKSELLINRGFDVNAWRHQMWLVRDQFALFGNYVVGLEEVPVPYSGGFAGYAVFSQNQLKIKGFLTGMGLKMLNYDEHWVQQTPSLYVEPSIQQFVAVRPGAYYRGESILIEFVTTHGFVERVDAREFKLRMDRDIPVLHYRRSGVRRMSIRDVKEVRVLVPDLGKIEYRRGYYYPGHYYGGRFSVKYPPQAGDEIGNYGWTGNMATQVNGWLSSGHRAYIHEEKIGGKTYYRYGRGRGDWPWVLMHHNLVNILETLGAKNPIKGTGQHGRFEWGTMSENIINIAHALFADRGDDVNYFSEESD